MPGPISHLVVANEILKKIPDSIVIDKAKYFAGVLAPDAIHARDGFVREDKKRTHFRSDIPDVEFHHKNKLELFHSRVDAYISRYLSDGDENWDLHFGYLVHILTDECMMLTIRQEFSSLMELENIKTSDREYFLRIMHELDSNDNNLYIIYDEIRDIQALLQTVSGLSVEGYLTSRELDISRDWVLSNYFNDEGIAEPKYIDYERFSRFIEYSALNIVGRLFNDNNFVAVI